MFRFCRHKRSVNHGVDGMRYIAAMGLATLLPVLAMGTPRTGRPVVVVAAPWSGAAVEAVARAGGLVLRGTAMDWIVVAVSDQPDFPARLRASGAWMIVDASAVAGCAPAADS